MPQYVFTNASRVTASPTNDYHLLPRMTSCLQLQCQAGWRGPFEILEN